MDKEPYRWRPAVGGSSNDRCYPTERAKPAKKQHGIRLVGTQTVAAHLTMSRANVRYFTERGLFEHKSANGAAGYDLDQCRDKYIAHLRREFRKNPRAELEADLQRHKARWLQLRIAKAEHELMPVAEFDHAIQTLAGLTLTTLSGWPARIAGTDLVLRRRAEALLLELRKALADECNRLADGA